MPLLLATKNQELSVVHITSDDKTKKHLENLGIIKGAKITIISKVGNNIILKILDSRIAIDENLARNIQVA